jgi:hypothetical protein
MSVTVGVSASCTVCVCECLRRVCLCGVSASCLCVQGATLTRIGCLWNFWTDFRSHKTLQRILGDAKRSEESIGEIFSPISRRNQKLQCFEVDARLFQMGEFV